MRIKSGLFVGNGADDDQLRFTQILTKRKLCGTPILLRCLMVLSNRVCSLDRGYSAACVEPGAASLAPSMQALTPGKNESFGAVNFLAHLLHLVSTDRTCWLR